MFEIKKAIWKYVLGKVSGCYVIKMLADSVILHVNVQGENLCIWAIAPITEDKLMINRNFQVFGTGHKFNNYGKGYIGTVFQGPFVWHVYEVYGPFD